MTTQTIDVKVTDNTKKILDSLGLSLAEAVDIFLDKINDEGKMPFEYLDFDLPDATDEEIACKLEEAEKSFKEGRFYTEEEFFSKMEKLYNV